MRLEGRRQQHADYYFRIHRVQIKPPYPVLLFCPNCGHGLIQVNSDTVEIANDFGLQPKNLMPEDAWSRIKHSCGATIVLYWTQ